VSLLPASTNADYRGSRAAAWFLALLAILTIIPGAIHYFLPDGGAGIIAGLDMGAQRETVIGVFAWMGATQIPYGIAQLLVALRYQTLVPLFLLLALLLRILSAVAAWITKGTIEGHHPPEHYATLVFIPLVLVFLVLSLRARKA